MRSPRPSLRKSPPATRSRARRSSDGLWTMRGCSMTEQSTSNIQDGCPAPTLRPVLLFLARFRCLRINRPVTGTAARLDTAPMASGCAGGTPTHWMTRHCKAATPPLPKWRSKAVSGGDLREAQVAPSRMRIGETSGKHLGGPQHAPSWLSTSEDPPTSG